MTMNEKRITELIRNAGGMPPATSYRMTACGRQVAVVNDYSGMVVELHGCGKEAERAAISRVLMDAQRTDAAREN